MGRRLESGAARKEGAGRRKRAGKNRRGGAAERHIWNPAQRLLWMLRAEDCRGICLFCRHYGGCREECRGRKGKEERGRMNMKNALRSEDTEQISVFQWAAWNAGRHPELKWLHHCPNGGSRNRAEAAKLKQMGVKAGIADLCLPYPKGAYCGLYIEMKYGGGRLQEAQKEFLGDMAEAGHFVAVCYSAEEVARVITQYLGLSESILHGGGIFDRAEEQGGTRIYTGAEGKLMEIPNSSILKDGRIKPV